jgi:hypothetical protein
LRVLVQGCSFKVQSLIAGVQPALENLIDCVSGSFDLFLIGMGDDLVHSFNAQAGLGGQIIYDRADNARCFRHQMLVGRVVWSFAAGVPVARMLWVDK